MKSVLAATTVLALLAGCQAGSQHLQDSGRTNPRSDSADALSGGELHYQVEDGEHVLIPRITLVRRGGFSAGQLEVKVTPSGRYHIAQRNQNNAHLSDGQLTKDQRRAIISAFKGWDELKSEYLPKNGTADDYTIELTYGDKTVTASDAAELPPTFSRAYETLRNRLSGFPSN